MPDDFTVALEMDSVEVCKFRSSSLVTEILVPVRYIQTEESDGDFIY